MPLTLTLTMDGVFLRAGRVRQTFNIPGQVRPAKPWDRLTQFGVMLHWPRTFDWLSVSAEVHPAAGGPGAAFADTPAGLDAVCAAHGVDRNQVAPVKFLEANAVLAASVPQQNRVLVTVEVDTDAAEFRQAVDVRRDAATGAVVQPIQLRFFDGKQFATYVDQPGRIDLTFKPCRPLPRFEGAMAVDLGNTVSTAAALSESDPVYRTDSATLLPLDTGATAGADPVLLPSVLRIDLIRTAAGTAEAVPTGTRRFPAVPADEGANAVTYVAGRMAAAGGGTGDLPEGVVFGAKQRLTVRDGEPGGPEGVFALTVHHERPGGGPPQAEKVDVLNRIPGELLFAHAVRRFREAGKAWAPDLVLTYPTTYSRRELNQLARAAVRGWLRAMGQPQSAAAADDRDADPRVEELATRARVWLASPPDPAGAVTDSGLIGLALDEATAAAFFHIHRRVFEQPGGLRRFRYLYPRGSRLLVIDCGGGTTDVALVKASAIDPDTLEVDVLGRTGLRAFGGDHITREVCRVLKARLQLLIARAADPGRVPAGLQPPPAATQAARMLAEFLEKTARLDPEDQFVPTRFDPDRVDADALSRRAAFHSLWRLGEAVKQKLGTKPVKLKEVDPVHFRRESSALMDAALRRFGTGPASQLLGQFQEITVSPWEIDALIRPQVEGLMARCNALVRRKLTGADGAAEEEVDWVVLSGNGARYPLVQATARELLHVAYLEDRLTFDPENLKNAVAKGAVMARMVERVPRSAGVKFNRNLSQLLPYDIVWHDLRGNTHARLFAEFTPYSEIAGSWRAVEGWRPPVGGVGQAATFVLERQFPGDDKYSPYASYRFEAGLQGRPEVTYDAAADRFLVRDSLTLQEGEYTDLTDPLEHQSPATRGDF